MEITIKGTPAEIAEALRKLSAPEDIKPILAPRHVPQVDPVVMPFIPYQPTTTDHWVGPWWGINDPVTGDPIGARFTYTM